MAGMAIFMMSIAIVPAMFAVAAVILFKASMVLWTKSPLWIPYILRAAAITIFLLFIVMIFVPLYLWFFTAPDSTKTSFVKGASVLLPLVELLFIMTVSIVILGIAIQIDKMELQHNVQLPHETTKIDTDHIEKKDFEVVKCLKCGKALKISQEHLLNTGKCKACNTRFVPYEHI